MALSPECIRGNTKKKRQCQRYRCARLNMAEGENKRRVPRRRVLKGAIIAYNDKHRTIPCTVHDISDRGARLRLHAMAAPDAFILIIELDGIEADCKVVWRKAPDIGVTFIAPIRKVAAKRAQSVTALAHPTKPSLKRK